MKVYEMYNMYQKFCWQIYRKISQKTEMIMKKVPVKVFYVELFLYRFDVYPNRISPLLQLRKDGHLYGNRHADYETVINGKELDMRKNRKNDSHTRRKRICIAALLLAGSLIPGGCGIKKEKTSDSELPEIVIGIDYFEPYSYQTSDGEYKGIDVELAEEAFQRLGYQPEFEKVVWEDKEKLLSDGTIDCLWSCYSMNERENKYQWAGPYMYSRQMVVVRAESEIRTLQDLKGKRIAVQATTKAEDLFLHNIKSDLPHAEQVNCFSSSNELYAALRKNYADAIAGHEAMLGSLIQDGKGAYRMLEESPYKSELGIAFKKGTHEELAEKLTETLTEMQSEGITEKIVTKYGLDADETLPGGESK